MTTRNGALAAALLACTALSATLVQAQDFGGQPVRGKQAGDIVLGAGLIGVLPEGGGRVSAIGGRPEASDTVTAQLDLTYFLAPQVSLNLIAATTRHDVHVRNSAIGDVDLGRVWALPPTLNLQFHPFPQARFSPYIGAGLNYTVFYGEGGARSAPVNKVAIDNAFGYGFNVGLDVEVSPSWLVNVDAKRLWLRPDVGVNGGAITGHANIDPWIVGASVRYRF